ncbi:UNVERIFIED_CONTAM: hypothetical protein FKN15_062379 [Acipenser sinensis]
MAQHYLSHCNPQQHSPARPRAPPRKNQPQHQLSYAGALAQPAPPATTELGEIKQLLNTLCSRLLD